MSWAKPIIEASCAPGGRAPTSETATDPSGRLNHSMWVERVPYAEGRQRSGADLLDAVVLGALDLAGQNHRPLHPRVAQDIERWWA